MSYRMAFGQDPLTCMAQGGIPTSSGGCVLTAGKDPEEIQCEVNGGHWDINAPGCVMPGAPPPVERGGMYWAAETVCRATGGEMMTWGCIYPNGQVLSQQQLVEGSKTAEELKADNRKRTLLYAAVGDAAGYMGARAVGKSHASIGAAIAGVLVGAFIGSGAWTA